MFTATILTACTAALTDRTVAELLRSDIDRVAAEAQAVALELNVYRYRSNRPVPVADMASPWSDPSDDPPVLKPYTPEQLADLRRRLEAARPEDVGRVLKDFRAAGDRADSRNADVAHLLRANRELQSRRAWAAAELGRLRREDAPAPGR